MKKLLSIIVIAFTGYSIYRIIKDREWKEANCEKIYYKRKTQVCVKYVSRPVMTGKTVIIQRYCQKYKDTLVLVWRYKCPEKP